MPICTQKDDANCTKICLPCEDAHQLAYHKAAALSGQSQSVPAPHTLPAPDLLLR